MKGTNVLSSRSGKLVGQSLTLNQKMLVIQFAIICVLTIPSGYKIPGRRRITEGVCWCNCRFPVQGRWHVEHGVSWRIPRWESWSKHQCVEEVSWTAQVGRLVTSGRIKVLVCIECVHVSFNCGREFLSSFHLPGEGQKIDRIMENFAQGYCASNPTIFSNPGVSL